MNGLHVTPDLPRLKATDGQHLAVTAVHSPRFDHERSGSARRPVVVRYDRRGPILQDSDFTRWGSDPVRA